MSEEQRTFWVVLDGSPLEADDWFALDGVEEAIRVVRRMDGRTHGSEVVVDDDCENNVVLSGGSNAGFYVLVNLGEYAFEVVVDDADDIPTTVLRSDGDIEVPANKVLSFEQATDILRLFFKDAESTAKAEGLSLQGV